MRETITSCFRTNGAASVSQRQWQMVSGSPASLSFVVGPGMLHIESDGWLLYDSENPAALGFWQSWLGKQQPALTLGGFNASFRFTRLSIQNLDHVPPAPPNAPVRPLTSATRQTSTSARKRFPPKKLETRLCNG